MTLNPFPPIMAALQQLQRTIVGITTLEARMLTEITALKNQVALNVAAEAKASDTLKSLAAQIADLSAKLNDALAGVVSQEDKDAIVKMTADLAASAATL